MVRHFKIWAAACALALVAARGGNNAPRRPGRRSQRARLHRTGATGRARSANLVAIDVIASNGVIHVIDRVHLPAVAP